MGDSDDTPPQRPGKRPASSWGDDERAEVGREHRGAESAKSGKRARRDAVHPLEFPVLVPPPDLVERELGGPGEVDDTREATKPWEILDRDELTADEQQIVQRSKRSSQDPLTFADGAKIMSRILRKELDERSAQKRRADEYMAIIDTTPSGMLALRVQKLEKRTKFWDRVLWILAIAIGGGLWVTADRIWARSAHETELQFRLKAVEDRLLLFPVAPTWLPQPSSSPAPKDHQP